MAFIQVSALICCFVAIQLVTDVRTVKAPTQENALLISKAQEARPSVSDCENFCRSVLSPSRASRSPPDDKKPNNKNRRKNGKNKKQVEKDGKDKNDERNRIITFLKQFYKLRKPHHAIRNAIDFEIDLLTNQDYQDNQDERAWWMMEERATGLGFNPLLYSIRSTDLGNNITVDMPALPEVVPDWSKVPNNLQQLGVNNETYQYLLTNFTYPVTDLDDATKIAMKAALPSDREPDLTDFYKLLKIGDPTLPISESRFLRYLAMYWQPPGVRDVDTDLYLSKAKLLDPAQVVETGKRLKAIGNDMLKKLIILRTYCAFAQYDNTIPKIGKSEKIEKLLGREIKSYMTGKLPVDSWKFKVAQIDANIRLQTTLYLYSKVEPQDRSIKPMTLDDYEYYISLKKHVRENSVAFYSTLKSDCCGDCQFKDNGVFIRSVQALRRFLEKYPDPETIRGTIKKDELILYIQRQAKSLDAGVSSLFPTMGYPFVDTELNKSLLNFIITFNFLRRAWKLTRLPIPNWPGNVGITPEMIVAQKFIRKHHSVLASYGNLAGLAGYGTLGVDLAYEWLIRDYNHTSAAESDADRSEEAFRDEAMRLAIRAFDVYAATETVALKGVDDKDKIFFYTYAKENCLKEPAKTNTFLSNFPDFELTYKCGREQPV